jgi:hypothetical protein
MGLLKRTPKTRDIPQWKGAVSRETQLTCEGQGRGEWKDGAATSRPSPAHWTQVVLSYEIPGRNPARVKSSLKSDSGQPLHRGSCALPIGVAYDHGHAKNVQRILGIVLHPAESLFCPSGLIAPATGTRGEMANKFGITFIIGSAARAS